MGLGSVIFLFGAALFVSTLKRPAWLGGRRHRAMADDTTLAMLKRSGRRSAGMWAMLIGAIFWSV